MGFTKLVSPRNLFTYSGFEFQRQIFHFSIKFFCKTQNLNQEKNLFHKERDKKHFSKLNFDQIPANFCKTGIKYCFRKNSFL